MKRRINVVLAEETIQLIDRLADKGSRSRFIDEAVRHFVDSVGRAKLRRQLKEGAERRATRDLALASEWFAIEEESWVGDRSC